MVSDLDGLRDEFPVLAAKAYLNAGTQGPVPRRSVEAAARELEAELSTGRGTAAHFEAIFALVERLRTAVAPLLGCEAGEVALTRSTTDGINVVLGALELGPGDEVLTSDEEHPGLLAPLAAARARRGFALRAVPFVRLAEEVRGDTALVACSHVSWVSGQIVESAALAAAAHAAGARFLLDGAQGLGALAFDVQALGCDFYAAAGQKWLCGPDGSGYLYVREDLCADLIPSWPSFVSLAETDRPSELALKPGAARFDLGVTARSQAAAALAALETLAEAGWDGVLERGPALAAELAAHLCERGARVVPRGPSTLVAWESGDPADEVERLADDGFVVRELPGGRLVRASVGAWSSEDELLRLTALVAPG
ncbi:MAG: Cysteine desulfurase [uncultured Solirubrobacterales bacterium]|uniref:Cysteine desulfurase n=1 Tax=uncultured Solirubrobacterales bacterium TaxID=768556 RepID=A0A6J4SVE8_9ACTN|nr:MAG: Cysteine desulfurase [uncultured Solirubrobacterales bacterium]